ADFDLCRPRSGNSRRCRSPQLFRGQAGARLAAGNALWAGLVRSLAPARIPVRAAAIAVRHHGIPHVVAKTGPARGRPARLGTTRGIGRVPFNALNLWIYFNPES